MIQSAQSENNPAKGTFEKVFSQAEKFDILSAYLDNEATEQEQSWVKHWLLSDSQLQQQYQNQLKIRSAIKAAWLSKDISK
ncbi:MAG: hypothetical protein WBA76_00575 [Phormidesmis sp.]